MLTAYAEAVVRYEAAVRETKKRPTIAQPVINRASGNVTGEKEIRNPAFATLREAQQQAATLARRLMIDPASAEKRQRLATRKARTADNLGAAAVDPKPHPHFTEEQISAVAEDRAQRVTWWHGDFRQDAIDELESIWGLLVNPTPALCVEIYFRLAQHDDDKKHNQAD